MYNHISLPKSGEMLLTKLFLSDPESQSLLAAKTFSLSALVRLVAYLVSFRSYKRNVSSESYQEIYAGIVDALYQKLAKIKETPVTGETISRIISELGNAKDIFGEVPSVKSPFPFIEFIVKLTRFGLKMTYFGEVFGLICCAFLLCITPIMLMSSLSGWILSHLFSSVSLQGGFISPSSSIGAFILVACSATTVIILFSLLLAHKVKNLLAKVFITSMISLCILFGLAVVSSFIGAVQQELNHEVLLDRNIFTLDQSPMIRLEDAQNISFVTDPVATDTIVVTRQLQYMKYTTTLFTNMYDQEYFELVSSQEKSLSILSHSLKTESARTVDVYTSDYVITVPKNITVTLSADTTRKIETNTVNLFSAVFVNLTELTNNIVSHSSDFIEIQNDFCTYAEDEIVKADCEKNEGKELQTVKAVVNVGFKKQ